MNPSIKAAVPSFGFALLSSLASFALFTASLLSRTLYHLFGCLAMPFCAFVGGFRRAILFISDIYDGFQCKRVNQFFFYLLSRNLL